MGTRNYYRKIGYELDGPYMSKSLVWIKTDHSNCTHCDIYPTYGYKGFQKNLSSACFVWFKANWIFPESTIAVNFSYAALSWMRSLSYTIIWQPIWLEIFKWSNHYPVDYFTPSKPLIFVIGYPWNKIRRNEIFRKKIYYYYFLLQ